MERDLSQDDPGAEGDATSEGDASAQGDASAEGGASRAEPVAAGGDEGGVGFAAIGAPTGSGDPGAPLSATVPPPVPPPVSPTPPVSPNDPMAAMPPPAPKKKSPVALIGIFLAVAGAALGAIFVKFVLPLILVGAAGQVFDAAFGGPYMRLPADVRAGYEQRIEAAVGDRFEGQTDAEQTAGILALVLAGLPRLDDGLVTTNFELTGKAIGAVDTASCAAVSRAFVNGTEPPSEPITAMIGTLSDAELQQWFEIRVTAIEYELAGTPAVIAVSDEEVAPLYDKIFELMDPAHIQTIGSIASGGTVEDGPLCEAIRGLYSSVLLLSPEETTLFARYDVSP